MKRIYIARFIAAALLTAAPLDSHAQQTPDTWISIYGLLYTNVSSLNDPDSNSRWRFENNAFGAGLAAHRQLGNALRLGVDASLARPKYERRDLETQDTINADGTASIATILATGRYGAGGGGDLGFYVTGGIGTVAYNLEDLDGWNADLALQAGTGIEYKFRPNRALALEWGRTWGYHEQEELEDGRQTHSALKLSIRFGF